MSSKYQVAFEKGAQKALKKMDKHQALLIMGWIQKNLVNCTTIIVVQFLNAVRMIQFRFIEYF